MNNLKIYQKFKIDSVASILNKIINFQNESEEFLCLVSLTLNCGASVNGYPVQLSGPEGKMPEMVTIKDKVNEDIVYILIDMVSAIRIYNAPEYIQVFSSGNFLTSIPKEEQITRFEAKRQIQKSWEDSQIHFPINIQWDTLPNDGEYNNYLRDTVDGFVKIFKEILIDELGIASLKSVSEFKLEYSDNSEALVYFEKTAIVCKFNLHFHPKKIEFLKAKVEILF